MGSSSRKKWVPISSRKLETDFHDGTTTKKKEFNMKLIMDMTAEFITLTSILFTWYVDFWFFLMKYLSSLNIYCWDALVSHRGVLACYPGTLLSHLFFRTLWTYMSLMTISIFDVILECLDICLICLNKTNVVCYISILTFMFYDSAWRAAQVRTLTLLYCNLIVFGMPLFKIT